MNFAETWKQWASVLACIAVLVTIVVRFSLAEDTLKEHDTSISQHEQVLDELVKARLAEDAAEKAAKAARNQVCRELREAGKIEKGECPPLE